jgi:adenine-specific DNA-methyltransferase
MDYIGSKTKLNKWIFDNIQKITATKTILDGCAGSGAVSRYAASLGYDVMASDLMKFSSVIANGSIGVSDIQLEEAKKHIVKLNALKGIKGFFYNNFCDKSTPARMYFTAENAMRIDHVRQEIEKITDAKVKDYLLFCGIEALSRVSNTAGVQAAYLKKFKARALERFTLREENVVKGNIRSYTYNILDLLPVLNKDYILYLDPPYNQRQYGPNYHLYETFVRNDSPVANGTTGIRNWKAECKSSFCVKKECLNFFKEIVKETTAKYIFISYNSDGLISLDELQKEIPGLKLLDKMLYRRYKADTSDKRKYDESDLFEYLLLVEK